MLNVVMAMSSFDGVAIHYVLSLFFVDDVVLS